MSDSPPATAPPRFDLDALLLETKLTAPVPRAGLVSRAEMISHARNDSRRVVAVSAPAGYGKSSLLAEWAAAETRPVAWISLDRYDDDPAVLLTLVATAYVRAVGGDRRLVTDMSSSGPSVLGRAAPRLASALRNSPVPFAIMIDDLHELRAPACHDVLSVLVSGVPAGSQLVATSRHHQPHVPWLRASDEVMEFGVDDLALDATGAAQIFASARASLAPELAEVLVERTEGWPVGLHLAALLARDRPGEAVTVSGDDPYVTDYLYRESLASLPEETQRFLRRTAVLERLSAELCDALLASTNAQSLLRELEASHAFLVPLDRHRRWYRYHALFREFLLAELRRSEPEVEEQLHARAADWYEANASAPNAVEHLLLTSDRDRAVRLVNRLALPVYESGQVATLTRWLDALGDDAIADYPPIAAIAGWASALTGQVRQAERWAALVEDAEFEGTPADGTASFASGRAMMRSFMCPAGPEQCLADAEFALAAEPSWSPWRELALAVGAEALLLKGDPGMADARFSEASALALAAGNWEIMAIADAERALLAMDQGSWEVAAGLVERTRSAIDTHGMHDYAAVSLAFAAAARLALHRGDRTSAQRELARAMRARAICTYVHPMLAVRLRLHTAIAHVAMGAAPTARHLMREIDDILAQRPALGALTDEVSRFRAVLDAAIGGGAAGPPLTPAELRLLPYLQTHLSMPEIGERLFVSRNTVRTEVSSIYRKLGVSSRTEAVERATAIGLLGA